MNWISSLSMSIPAHMSFVEDELNLAMNSDLLTEIESHGVALLAAILSNNSELAFEISMNSPLFGNPIRETISIIAARSSIDLMTEIEPRHSNEMLANALFCDVATRLLISDMRCAAPARTHAAMKIAAIVFNMNKIII